VKQFVSKLLIFKGLNFHTSCNLFLSTFRHCLKYLVTLIMVTDKPNFVKIRLKHIREDVIIKDSIINSSNESFQSENSETRNNGVISTEL